MSKKPYKVIVEMNVAHAWSDDGSIYQPKLDGMFTEQLLPDETLVVGESVASRFTAFDILTFQKQDVSKSPLSSRLSLLREVCAKYDLNMIRCHTHGGNFLREVLLNGGEGIVRKDPAGTYWAPMFAAKRLSQWQCVVTGFVPGSQVVTIADAITTENRGKVALFGGKCSQVRVGSVLKVEGMQLHKTGKIREPRICQDSATSWLVKF